MRQKRSDSNRASLTIPLIVLRPEVTLRTSSVFRLDIAEVFRNFIGREGYSAADDVLPPRYRNMQIARG
ncbi:MAG: hypothetical protein OXH06_19220 [Gemmatimonadetes bacterium]|nr:hypothetical protein [Gemmatimonadota bacterium]